MPVVIVELQEEAKLRRCRRERRRRAGLDRLCSAWLLKSRRRGDVRLAASCAAGACDRGRMERDFLSQGRQRGLPSRDRSGFGQKRLLLSTHA